MLAAATVVILLVAWLITAIVQGRADDKLEAQPGSLPAEPLASSLPAESTSAGADAPAGTDVPVDNSSWNFIGPVAQTINNMQILSPDYRMIALPENGRVDMSYFSTVTFVGDSITQGLELYKTQGIPNARYCAYKSIGPKQIYDGSIQTRADGTQEVPIEALVASAPRNVYILLGTNAMVGMDDASLLAYYQEMLTALRAALSPDVNFYIQAITPVRPGIDRLPQERITGLNHALAAMAWANGVNFVDLNEPLAGDDGYLREDFSGSDGYHLTPAGYSAWVEYLVTHTAYSPENPYLEGSAYYQPVQPPAPEADPAALPPEAQPVV